MKIYCKDKLFCEKKYVLSFTILSSSYTITWYLYFTMSLSFFYTLLTSILLLANLYLLFFPPITLFSQPLYYEDLKITLNSNPQTFNFGEDEKGFQESDLTKLQDYFKYSLGIISSLFLSVIVYYYAITWKISSNLSFLERLGVMGGLFSIWKSLIFNLGKVLLFLINYKNN